MTSNNIDFYPGDSGLVRARCVDKDGGNFDLTNIAEMTFSIFKHEDGALLLTKSLGKGIAITDPPSNGIFTIQIDPADTAKMWGVGYYGVKMVDDSGRIYTMRLQDADTVESFPRFKFL